MLAFAPVYQQAIFLSLCFTQDSDFPDNHRNSFCLMADIGFERPALLAKDEWPFLEFSRFGCGFYFNNFNQR